MNNYCAVLLWGFALYWATFYSFTNATVGSDTSAHQSKVDEDSESVGILIRGKSSDQSPEKLNIQVSFSPDVKDGSHRRTNEYRTQHNDNKEEVKRNWKEYGDLGWTHTTFANNIFKNEMSWSTDRNLLLSPVALEVSLAAFFTEIVDIEGLQHVVKSLLRVDVMKPRSSLTRWMFPPDQRFTLSRQRMRDYYYNKLQLISLDSVNIESILFFGEKISLDENGAYLLRHYFKTKSYSISRYFKHDGKPVPFLLLIPPGLRKNYKANLFILASALSFRGKWKIKFDQKLTRENYFIGEKSKKLLTFISKTGKYYYVDNQDESYKIIELLFEKNDGPFSLLIFLPYGTNSLLDLENHLANRSWLQDLDLPEAPSTRVHVTIPRFSIQDSWNFQEFLREGANLKPDRVHGIVQSVFLSIDESGVTSDTMTTPELKNSQIKTSDNSPGGSMTMDDHPSLTFVANRPFMFALVHRTEKIVLLQGHVVD